MPKHADDISKIDLFRGVPDAGYAIILSSSTVQTYLQGQRVFEQGKRADRAYALATGGIRIVQTGSNGGEAILRFITPGSVFGIVPLFTDHEFPADAVSSQPSLVYSWSEKTMLDLMHRFPAIGINLIRIIGQRLSIVQERVRELSTQRVEPRIAQAILRLAIQAGIKSSDSTTITIPLRRKDIAALSGTTLHSASRIIAAWEKAGYVESENSTIRVINSRALERISSRDPG